MQFSIRPVGVTLIVTLAAFASPSPSLAADGYVRASVGMATATAGGTLQTESTLTNDALVQETSEFSLGAGAVAEIAAGFTVTRGLALELGLGYTYGQAASSHSMLAISSGNGSNSTNTTTHDRAGTLIRATPAVVLSAELARTTIYARFGPTIASATATDRKLSSTATSIDATTVVLHGGLALGWCAAVGASVQIADRIDIYGELGLTSLAYKPQFGSLTESTSNGVDKLPGMTTRKKEVEFKDKVTTLSGEANDGLPDQAVASRLPFSTIAGAVGVRMRF